MQEQQQSYSPLPMPSYGSLPVELGSPTTTNSDGVLQPLFPDKEEEKEWPLRAAIVTLKSGGSYDALFTRVCFASL